jgi:CheY-like chemotaxis protein
MLTNNSYQPGVAFALRRFCVKSESISPDSYDRAPQRFFVSPKTQRLLRFALDDGPRLRVPISLRSVPVREVLVVDDDLSTREALSDLLQDRGYSVTTASDGREALNYLRDASPPGIIILDLMMPVMDGWEFLRHQAHDPTLLDIPVIVVTAMPPRHPLRAKAVLQKPIQFESLLEMIERFLLAQN